jgi:hypothetical protein
VRGITDAKERVMPSRAKKVKELVSLFLTGPM